MSLSLLSLVLIVVQSLEVKIQPTSKGEPIVQVTYSNEGSEDLILCTWNSPLDIGASGKWRSHVFNFLHTSGAEALYIGIIPYRKPSLSDFVRLGRGQSITANINLLDGYWFPSVGEYQGTLETSMRVFTGKLPSSSTTSIQELFKKFRSIDIKVEPFHFMVSKTREWPSYIPTQPLESSNTTNLVNCTEEQAIHANTSAINALNTTTLARQYINKTNCMGIPSGYTTWFGACTAPRSNSVRSILDAIKNVLTNNTYQIKCNDPECTDDYYAWVYWQDPTHTIYVCYLFWAVTADRCDLDNGPGTLTHEISHFYDCGATYDHKYGVSDCLALAAAKPNKAIENADNYAFFIESCYLG